MPVEESLLRRMGCRIISKVPLRFKEDENEK